MILITGVNGFIGINLVKKLIERGYKVRGFLFREDKRNIDLLKELGIDIVYGDILDKDSLVKAMRDIKIVIHLAALIGSDNPILNYKINFLGSKNLIEACNKKNIKRVIWTSSSAALWNIDTAYSKTKKEVEKLFLNSKLNMTILRLSLVYGKDGGIVFKKLVNNIRNLPFIPVIGSGFSKKQPVYVGDVVEAIIAALNTKKSIKKVYDLGGPDVVSLNEFIDEICYVLNIKKIKIKLPMNLCMFFAKICERIFPKLYFKEAILGFSQDAVGDISLAKKELNYNPISLKEGLKKSFENGL